MWHLVVSRRKTWSILSKIVTFFTLKGKNTPKTPKNCGFCGEIHVEPECPWKALEMRHAPSQTCKSCFSTFKKLENVDLCDNCNENLTKLLEKRAEEVFTTDPHLHGRRTQVRIRCCLCGNLLRPFIHDLEERFETHIRACRHRFSDDEVTVARKQAKSAMARRDWFEDNITVEIEGSMADLIEFELLKTAINAEPTNKIDGLLLAVRADIDDTPTQTLNDTPTYDKTTRTYA